MCASLQVAGRALLCPSSCLHKRQPGFLTALTIPTELVVDTLRWNLAPPVQGCAVAELEGCTVRGSPKGLTQGGGLPALPTALFLGRPSQAASARATVCLASLEQQTEASAALSGELLYLETNWL